MRYSCDPGTPGGLLLLRCDCYTAWCGAEIMPLQHSSVLLLWLARKLQASQTCQVQSLNFYFDFSGHSDHSDWSQLCNGRLKIHVSRLKAFHISFPFALFTCPCCTLCLAHMDFIINISFDVLISFCWSAVWSFVWGMAQQRTAWIWHGAEARGFAILPEFNVRNLICLFWKYRRSETDQAFWCQCSTGSRYQACVPGMVLYVLYCFIDIPGHVWSATSRDIGAGRFSETNGCFRRIWERALWQNFH